MTCHNIQTKKTRTASIERGVNATGRMVNEVRKGYPVTVQQISAFRPALEAGKGQ
jgi:hypothetical protein